MATGGTDREVRGMGDGKMQWIAPMQWVNEAGAVVFSIDSAGAAVSASTITGNSLVDAAGAVAFAAGVSVGTTLAVTGASTLTGNVAAGGTLAVTGDSTLTGNVSCGGTLAVTGASTLTGAVTCSAGLSAGTSFALAGIETSLTAHVGGGQGSALALSATKMIHNVTTVGSANDSVILPAATGSGKIHLIKNSAAANSLQLYAASTETIDGVTSATGVAIAAGKSRLVVDGAAGNWFSLLGA